MPIADLILKNANVITMDPAQPTAGLVAIKDGRILLVADADRLESVKGAGSRILDCQGKTVVPGFIDAHCHIFSFLRKLISIDLSPAAVSSIADIKAAIRRRAEETPAGCWLSGTDYNEFYIAEKRHPTRWDIDEVAPDHPVVLSHRSLHACVLNSIALSLAGISGETEEPPGGYIARDLDSGEPNGLLFEMLGYVREKVMPPISDDELRGGVALASEHYLSLGITSLQDATVVNDLGRWQKFRRFQDSGILKSRVCMMAGHHAFDRFLEAGLAYGDGDYRLRLGAVKVVPSQVGGQLYPSQAELNQLALKAQQAGFPVAIHAIAPATVEAAITALEFARSQQPGTDVRHRIEHCAECSPPLLQRMKELQVVVATQPPFLYYSGERYLARVPAERLPWLYRFGSLINSGLVVAGSSDSPIVPDNPLVGIYAAVTRQTESGQSLQPEECVSVIEALAMYTVNGAYVSSEEKIKGSISQGKLADLVLLDADPTRTPRQQIKDIKVEMTIIDGQVVWEA